MPSDCSGPALVFLRLMNHSLVASSTQASWVIAPSFNNWRLDPKGVVQRLTGCNTHQLFLSSTNKQSGGLKVEQSEKSLTIYASMAVVMLRFVDKLNQTLQFCLFKFCFDQISRTSVFLEVEGADVPQIRLDLGTKYRRGLCINSCCFCPILFGRKAHICN